ncbi:MAG: Gfo/Idh/MocA family oxidoreductase [Spirochaetia bacterium]|jgi:myo-inositol 2-dehydrogenase/D-chiro-inositol 1-dehydrogenase|nr:Gfo/Idh/MocA family oxidoreductase [Spirochaetia bacterium]
MKVGIIGFGAWGSIHAASVAALPGKRLAAISCHSEESAAKAREQYPQTHVFTDYKLLLEMQEVEAVHVVVPSYLHTGIALAALEAGKHVLLEKPMATTLEDCQRIVQAAERAESERCQITSIVHEMRCSVQWSALRKAIDAGTIGKPHYAMLNLFRFPYRQGKGNWRYDPAKVGSWVLEEPIHFFDLLLWYMEPAGKPLAVTALTNEYAPGLCRDFTATVEFESGAYAVVSQTLSGFEHHQVVEVTGSNGAVRSIWSGAMDRTDKPDWSVRVKSRDQEEAAQLQLSEPSGELFEISRYIDLAHKGFSEGSSIYTPRQEMELIRLCLAAERSARTRARITLD